MLRGGSQSASFGVRNCQLGLEKTHLEIISYFLPVHLAAYVSLRGFVERRSILAPPAPHTCHPLPPQLPHRHSLHRQALRSCGLVLAFVRQALRSRCEPFPGEREGCFFSTSTEEGKYNQMVALSELPSPRGSPLQARTSELAPGCLGSREKDKDNPTTNQTKQTTAHRPRLHHQVVFPSVLG